MSTIRTKLGEAGRVIIPATFRQNLRLKQGDDLILHMQDDIIYITTPNQALRTLQTKVKNYFNTVANGKHISLVDELISMRRLEVDSE